MQVHYLYIAAGFHYHKLQYQFRLTALQMSSQLYLFKSHTSLE